MGTPHGPGHARPRLLESKNTLDIVARDLLAGDGVDDSGFNAEEGQGCTAWLGGSNSTEGSDDVRAGLSLPVGLFQALALEHGGLNRGSASPYVANVSFLLSDLLKVPLPDLSGNWFTDGAQDTQVLHLVVDVLITGTLQQTQSCGGDIELGDLVLLNDIPVAGEVGVGGSAFENDGRATKKKRRIDDVGVSGDPANVTTAEEAIVVMNVKDVLAGHRGTKEVAGSSVHNTLGLTSRTRGVEEEEGVLGAHRLRSEIAGVLLDLLMPPNVTPIGPRDFGTSALVDQHTGHIGALLEGLIDNALGANHLATTLTLVRGDNNLGSSIKDTVTQGVRGETSEDNGVNGTDTGTGEKSHNGFRNHGKVDRDSVTLLDTPLLQDPGNAGDFAEELAVGNDAALIRLIGLVDDRDLIRVLDGMTIHAVERGIQATFDEPGIVSILERPDVRGLEVFVESEQLTGHAGPERVRATDRLVV